MKNTMDNINGGFSVKKEGGSIASQRPSEQKIKDCYGNKK